MKLLPATIPTRFVRPALLALAVASPAGALAQETDLSYTWLQLDYANLDVDDYGDEGNLLDDFDNGAGWAVSGSLEFTPNWFGFLSYSETDADASFIDDQNVYWSSDSDMKKLDAGVGFHTPLNDATDIVARAAYRDLDQGSFNFGANDDDVIDRPGDAFDDLNEDDSDGFFIDAALRSQLAQQLEGSLGVRYTDVAEVDGVSLIGNLLYEFTPQLGLNLGVDAGDDLAIWTAGVRFTF